MTEDLAHSSAITRHPSASLYDRVFATAFPDVAVVASHKNVVLLDGEQEAVLRYALKGVSRKTLKLVLHGNDDACWHVSLTIDHALDVLAMKRLIMIGDSICKKEPQPDADLIAMAEANLRKRSANDKTRTCAIWRNPIEEMTDYLRSVFAGPSISLPYTATVNTVVRGARAARALEGGQA